MATLDQYQCPNCGRSFSEMRGPLMSDGGLEPSEKREQRRLMLRPLRDRLHGIKRRPPQAGDTSDTPDASDPELRFFGVDSELIICRRCDLVMPVVMRAMVD